jgi:hypothetical protein
MKITRKSLISGIERTLEINITEEQFEKYLKGDDLIQNLMPELSANEREFIISGVTPEEWDQEFENED